MFTFGGLKTGIAGERRLLGGSSVASTYGLPPATARTAVLQLALAVLSIAATSAVAGLAFAFHADLSTVGFLELMLVLLASLQLGLLQATVVSLSAFVCLNFLFIPPLFSMRVSNPQNWISLFTFEAGALLVSVLSSKVRLHAARAEEQQLRALKLYELSRAVLLVDQRSATSEQLGAFIREILNVEQVEFWTIYEDQEAESGRSLPTSNPAHAVHLGGTDSDGPEPGHRRRVLKLGTTVFGGLLMRGGDLDPLSADAVASIASVAFEHTRAIRREYRAEIERDAERLRAAVLDGLAHGFKTPLTAIQTASSGLLAIEHLTQTQAELVSIIDERATMLSQLTTRLLQTAALEAREIRLRRNECALAGLIERLVRQQDDDVRARIEVVTPGKLASDEIDPPMIELAMQQLVDNAAKYSAIGSLIRIKVSQSDSETAITVENESADGYLIRPEERARIFERFYRGADAARGPSGTGLGLSIVKKIAEAHGGRAWTENADGKTRFIFTVQRYHKEIHG